jgi:hypothetical protein
MAAIYCQLGEKEKAFELLAKGFERRSLWMAHIKMEPRFDPCRDDKRFTEFLRKVYESYDGLDRDDFGLLGDHLSDSYLQGFLELTGFADAFEGECLEAGFDAFAVVGNKRIGHA